MFLCFCSVLPAPPKVTNVKIVGNIRENNKVTVTGVVTGGSEGCSRVQWFKTHSSVLDGENGLEAVSTSKIAKVGYFNSSKDWLGGIFLNISFVLHAYILI